jgi:hypothetical protein
MFMSQFNAAEFLATVKAKKTPFSLTDPLGRTVKFSVDGGCKNDYDDAQFNALVASADVVKVSAKIETKDGFHITRNPSGVSNGPAVAKFLPQPIKFTTTAAELTTTDVGETAPPVKDETTVPDVIADRMNAKPASNDELVTSNGTPADDSPVMTAKQRKAAERAAKSGK